MKEITFTCTECGFSKSEILSAGKPLLQEIERMTAVAKSGSYGDERSSINLPSDKGSIKCITDLAKKFRNVDYIVVIGIGGSNLGTIAVSEAVKGKLHNHLAKGAKALFADTVDSDSISEISKLIKISLSSKKKILLNIVTKSGTTTETIANFHILLDTLKKYGKNYQNYVVVATDQNSKLYDVAVKEGFHILEIPKKVGGRYSVFSAVGLFPLAALGINTGNLLKGALDMRAKCLNTDIMKNPAAISAVILYLHYKKKVNINDNFFFSNDMESIGKWYRQLMGESIGKQHDKRGNTLNAGITPTVSIGSTDLHSMAQLYLGGPYDKYTTFISIHNPKNKIKIPKINEMKDLVANIEGKSMHEIMEAILKGVQIAYNKGKRPYSEIMLPDKSEYSIGQLLQFKMMEMMYLGFLLDVNPFDQPNVEDYKNETKKLLEQR